MVKGLKISTWLNFLYGVDSQRLARLISENIRNKKKESYIKKIEHDAVMKYISVFLSLSNCVITTMDVIEMIHDLLDLAGIDRIKMLSSISTYIA